MDLKYRIYIVGTPYELTTVIGQRLAENSEKSRAVYLDLKNTPSARIVDEIRALPESYQKSIFSGFPRSDAHMGHAKANHLLENSLCIILNYNQYLFREEIESSGGECYNLEGTNPEMIIESIGKCMRLHERMIRRNYRDISNPDDTNEILQLKARKLRSFARATNW